MRSLRVSGAFAAGPGPRAEISNRAEALGFLYVIEGSTLGGRLILRELAAGGAEITGLSFLDPFGAEGALERAAGNRTVAAEMLGLSRQSLYAKLGRYGLDGGPSATETAD